MSTRPLVYPKRPTKRSGSGEFLGVNVIIV